MKLQLSTAERKGLMAAIAVRPPSTTAGLESTFGRFRYRDLPGGQIEITDQAWVTRNIVEVDVARELPGWPVNSTTGRPQGKLYVHRLIKLPLLLAWRHVRLNGFDDELRTYDGLWVPRHILHDRRNPLSVHSWGAAIDLDARWNGYGVKPVISQNVVRIFEMFGFAWGGRWHGNPPAAYYSAADGMHVEFCDLAPYLKPRVWQDSAIRGGV
ncbi:M15 family metallopeptidase [Deinococcus yavapaiensis]|uniref:D-alanyl-D-alanine carboxypeptidase-like protein n=1 Tax=Deinococcus yavapaiensis KR-236 TaxID=694435 RepID=A0A318S796_9DEIO|nr:M15 family metallopeptidase [Deinococcus yavapaiensis]PYE51060.1 D-alanyl-D-alanine carboxypeptidase-like protein [Deinococcus yavapaiensis KR-236]